jgi:uncharacterized protein (DUF2141 family)
MKNLILIAVILLTQNSFSATLTLRFKNMEEVKGTVRWAAYIPGSKFASPGQAKYNGTAEVTNSEITVKAEGIPFGTYAIACYQDLDNDDHHSRIFPTEPFGFSNGARASWFGPPKFDAAKFEFTSESQTFDIEMRETP